MHRARGRNLSATHILAYGGIRATTTDCAAVHGRATSCCTYDRHDDEYEENIHAIRSVIITRYLVLYEYTGYKV